MMGIVEEDLLCIYRLIQQDLGNRQFTPNAHAKDFIPAVGVLNDCRRFLILTGFCVLDSMTGETDGLSGALVLASALMRLGKEVVLVTDSYSADLLEAASRRLETRPRIYRLPQGQEAVDEALSELEDELRPDCVISIERPGRAEDGHSYSMRGERLDPFIPQLDDFFLGCRSRGCRTIGIGDGGNELGMGSLSGCIRGQSSLGCLIACTTEADFSVPAAVSSWAGYGLAGALSLINGRNLLPSSGTEELVIESIAAEGGMDGVTRRREATVDGLSMELYLRPLLLIYGLIGDRLPDVGDTDDKG